MNTGPVTRGDVTTEPGDVLVLLGTNEQLERALRILDRG